MFFVSCIYLKRLENTSQLSYETLCLTVEKRNLTDWYCHFSYSVLDNALWAN
jgi:hypothetical protein